MTPNDVASFLLREPVLVIAKSYCGYSNNAAKALSSLGVPFKRVDVDVVEGGADLLPVFSQLSGITTVPQARAAGPTNKHHAPPFAARHRHSDAQPPRRSSWAACFTATVPPPSEP